MSHQKFMKIYLYIKISSCFLIDYMFLINEILSHIIIYHI